MAYEVPETFDVPCRCSNSECGNVITVPVDSWVFVSPQGVTPFASEKKARKHAKNCGLPTLAIFPVHAHDEEQFMAAVNAMRP